MLDIDKVKKVAALHKSPHQGEADTARRKSLKMIEEAGGPTFDQIIEWAIKQINAPQAPKSEPYTYPHEKNKARSNNTADWRREQEAKADWEYMFRGLMQDYVDKLQQNETANWGIIQFCYIIRTNLNRLPSSKATRIARCINDRAWGFIGDLNDKGSMYATHLSEKQLKWLISSFGAIVLEMHKYSLLKQKPWLIQPDHDDYIVRQISLGLVGAGYKGSLSFEEIIKGLIQME